MQKINFITPIVFEISKFLRYKNPAIWLAEGIFEFNLRTRFFPGMQFQQDHIGYYGAWFKPKKSTNQWAFFCKIQKNPIFGVSLGIIPKMRFFSQKSGSISFLPLTQHNFMTSFRETL